MKILIFDTETTGLPTSRESALTSNSWPHLVSISWVLLNTDTNKIEKEVSEIIFPENWQIPIESTNIHGISHDTAVEQGVFLKDSMAKLFSQSWDAVACHNFDFDNNVITQAMKWDLGIIGYLGLQKYKNYCTMKLSKNICKLPGKFGYKNPKLSELYYYTFKHHPNGQLHSSAYDTKILAEIIQNCQELRLKMDLPVTTTHTSNEIHSDTISFKLT
jgi:DNA polymerase-3 subunit epsilon